MTVQTFQQPNYTADSGVAYPGNIDKAIAVLAEASASFAVHEQPTPNMTVRVDAGKFLVGLHPVPVAAQTSATITAPTTNPRIDRVVLDVATRAVTVIQGTEAASPVASATSFDYVSLATILLQPSTTSITNSMITDDRSVAAFRDNLRVPWQHGMEYFTDFSGNYNSEGFYPSANGAGSYGVYSAWPDITPPSATYPMLGMLRLSSLADAAGGAKVSGPPVPMPGNLPNRIVYETVVCVRTLSTSAQRYVIKFGLNTGVSDAAPGDIGFYFKYSDNLSGGQWQGVYKNFVTELVVTSASFVVTADTVYRLKLVYHSVAQTLDFYVAVDAGDYALLGTHSGIDLSTSYGSWSSYCAILAKTVGTADRFVDIDMIRMRVFTKYKRTF